MSLSETVQEGLENLDSLAELSSKQLKELLEINMQEVHRFLLFHERDFPERLVNFHGISRGLGLVRSFNSSSDGLRFFFDADGMYEFYNRESLRRGDDLGEHRGVTSSLTIVKEPNLSRFGLEFFSAFLAGLREFLESEKTIPLVSVPTGHYVFRYNGVNRSGEDRNTEIHVEENLQDALSKFCHFRTIDREFSFFRDIEVAVQGRDKWFLLNNGSGFDKFDINKLSLPEEIRHV